MIQENVNYSEYIIIISSIIKIINLNTITHLKFLIRFNKNKLFNNYSLGLN